MRPKAEGFALAPLVEAVFAFNFEGGIAKDKAALLADALAERYPIRTGTPHKHIHFNLDSGEFEVQDTFNAFRLEGSDPAELLLIRPEGIAVSQLAPYKSWEVLFDRARRDLESVWPILGQPVDRLATRYINRIDVPLEGGIARYEDYLVLHINLPDGMVASDAYQLQLQTEVPELGASAVIRSGQMQPVVSGRASFALDIDLFRTMNLPSDCGELLGLLSRFRDQKNDLYRRCLTAKALEEFK